VSYCAVKTTVQANSGTTRVGHGLPEVTKKQGGSPGASLLPMDWPEPLADIKGKIGDMRKDGHL
jgi:hypothetical protein